MNRSRLQAGMRNFLKGWLLTIEFVVMASLECTYIKTNHFKDLLFNWIYLNKVVKKNLLRNVTSPNPPSLVPYLLRGPVWIALGYLNLIPQSILIAMCRVKCEHSFREETVSALTWHDWPVTWGLCNSPLSEILCDCCCQGNWNVCLCQF